MHFENYAEGSIARMKAAKLAISYYERVKARLLKKEDLSSELPITKKVGPEGTMTVVKAAIADYRRQVTTAWEMNPKLREVGKYKCTFSSVPTFFRGERAVEAQFLNFCMGRVV